MDKTAIIYARVSTVGQAEEELPVSSQLEHCEKKAVELGATVLDVFTDDGISGRSDSRPAFQDAIAYAETRGPDYFITWSSSRFARNRVDAGFYKRRLDQAGVRLTYCSMEVDTGTDSGWLLDSVMEIFDELYSRQVAADTRRSLVRNAQRGYWNGGRPPFGFVPVAAADDPKRKRLQPQAEEAAVVRQIFQMRAQGLGSRSIAIDLNDRGVANRGKRWNKTVIGYLLRNEALIGRTVFGKRTSGSVRRQRPKEQWTVVESHEPVVPRELWDRVQQLLDVDRDNAGVAQSRSSHLFTGLLVCGECGSRMHTESARGRSKRYWYYNCRAAALERTHEPRRLNADELDDFLVDLICDEILSPDRMRAVLEEWRQAVSDWQLDRDERHQAVVSEIKEVERRNSRLFDVLELHGKDAPNLGDITRRLRDNKGRLQQLERELARIEAEVQPALPITDDDIDLLADVLVSAIKESENPKKTRAFFASFVEKIEIRGEEVVVEYDPQKVMNRPKGAVLTSAVWLPGTARGRTKTVIAALPTGLCKVA